MQISVKCSIAIHCLVFIHEAKGITKVTSNLLAESTGINPVIIRNILSSLKKAGIITVQRGTGGAELNANPTEINLYQIYTAIDQEDISSLIGIHKCEGRSCPIAKNIHAIVDKPYEKIATAVKETMQSITLQSMIDDYHLSTKYQHI